MSGIFVNVTIILLFAAVLSLLAKWLKLPTILAYIIAGIIFTATGLHGLEDLEALSKIGVTLLLFILGLELKFSELRKVGKIALITGIGQILFTTIFGYIICILLGMNTMTALFVSFAITFSSTIVIVKLFSDKKELNSLHGRITVGFLLVQDFSAIIALIFMTSIGSGQTDVFALLLTLLKAIGLLGVGAILSQEVFPAIVKRISNDTETLFVFSLAWAFVMAGLVTTPFFGFTIEIGGFIAGLTLASCLESTQIVSKAKALRDFFVVIFFAVLGAKLDFGGIAPVIFPALVLSIFILVGNPLIVMVLLRQLGYKVRTGFMCGLAVAQISEFSLVLVFLGLKQGVVSEQIVAMVTVVGIVTFTISSLMIMNSEKLFNFLAPYLKMFEKKNVIEPNFLSTKEMSGHTVMVGVDRMGKVIARGLDKENLLLIDFDPETVRDFSEDGYNVVFGDATDYEIVEKCNLKHAKIIISSIPTFEDNLILLNFVKDRAGVGPYVILTAHRMSDREELLKYGADHVIMPYKISGEVIAKMVKEGDFNRVQQNIEGAI
jgi:Kef-type K+ transport system membrane component KefB